MNDIPLSILFGALTVLLFLSAFFSSAETGLLTLNRYRLRHLVKIKHRGAMRAHTLLLRTDRLIGLILLGNNFVNNSAAVIAGLIGLKLSGDAGVAIATGLFTVVMLIFAEVAPKTLAAQHPERIAFPAAYVLGPLLRVSYPLVWLVSTLANGLLRVFGISATKGEGQHLSYEELRTVVNEAGALIPQRHQKMLLGILDLEKVTVEDVMIPRNEITGIDLHDEWSDIVTQITSCPHTRLVVHRGGVDNVIGLLQLRDALRLLARDALDEESLVSVTQEPYFVPLTTPLNTQMLNFQRQRERVGLVVNEYGDIQGLVTLEDILEEIVGEFTTGPLTGIKEVRPQDDGSYLVDGSVTLRDLNRLLHWQLPTNGPKTLNGLILDYLEAMPEPGTSLRIGNYLIEIVQITANAVKTLTISVLAEPENEEGGTTNTEN